MSSRLCCLLVVLPALIAAAAPPPPKTCSGGGVVEAQVDGWPVEIAIRVAAQANVSMNLSLMNHKHKHTNLTFIHIAQKSHVVIMQMNLKTEMAINSLDIAGLLVDSAWATVKIIARHKELELKINSNTHSSRYSSIALLNITDHLHVNKIACTSSQCKTYMDLQCRQSKKKTNKEHKTPPPPVKAKSSRGVYYWGFYVVLLLLVLACILFLVWRNERNKFRSRWMRHSQIVSRMNSTSGEVGDPDQASGEGHVVEYRAETSNRGCINPAYFGNTSDNNNN